MHWRSDNSCYQVLLKSFLPKPKRHKGIITKSVRELALDLAQDENYRKSEKLLRRFTHSEVSPFSYSALWQQIQEVGKEAQDINISLSEQSPINVCAKTLYVMVDGVHVSSQETGQNSMEAKIGLLLTH